MNRKELEELWEEATQSHHLAPWPDCDPLAASIITEVLEGGGDGETCDPKEASQALYRLINDVESFASAIANTTAKRVPFAGARPDEWAGGKRGHDGGI